LQSFGFAKNVRKTWSCHHFFGEGMIKTIRLRLGIATVFATLTMFLILVMTRYLYLANSKPVLKTIASVRDNDQA